MTSEGSSEARQDAPGIDPDRVVVRQVRADDAAPIAAHLLRCFDRWPSFEINCSISDHVDWKLHANAESWAQQIVATLDDDDQYIVALAIRVRRPGWVLGEDRVVLDVTDQSVHPDWRMMHINEKRDAFRKESGHENHALQITWLPRHPATRKSNLKNPTLGNRVLVFWKPSSLRNLISVPYRTAGWRHAARVAFEAARGHLRRPRSVVFDGEIVELTRFDDRTDALWEQAKPAFDFAIARTQDYMNWRYADPRAGRFVIRAAVGGGELIGYCITKLGGDRGEIVDVLVAPDRLDALEALLADAVLGIEREGAGEIQCWLPQRHSYVETLRGLGFLDSGRDPSLRYGPMVMTEEELTFLLDPATRVHITRGDSDLV